MAANLESLALTRAMNDADLDKVLALEAAAYEFPWSRGIFNDCLKSGYDCRVLSGAGNLLGYTIMSVAAGEAHLLNVCIDPLNQRQGLGRALVLDSVARARILGGNIVFLEVRPSNHVALKLYDTLGFTHIGVRKDYYPSAGGREDAWVLAYEFPADT